MDDIGTTTIASGQQALSKLLEDIKRDRLDWNEAETRFNIIDRIITECLGWPRRDIRLEQPQDRKFSDYELGSPRCCIWEAKRENRTFELPANPTEKLILDLPSIIALGGEAAHAVKQVQEYCSHRDVELAAATNGQQLIAFLASRNDGIAPLNGHCLVVSSYSQWNEHFSRLWQLLSPAGVAERRLSRFLRVGEEASLPRKASNLLGGYPKYRYPSYLHDSLRSISELLLIDLMEQPDVERQFYAQCYCDSGALSQHALISKQMLAARYAALFDLSEPAPRAVPVIDRAGRLTIRAENIADASAQRPIVILGDVGVGKTSFLKHLMYIRASEEFKNAICIYIDLGSRGALTKNLDHFILDDIERQLLDTYGIDIREDSFVRAVYHSDITRFDRGTYGVRRKEDPAFYDRKLLELLDSKVGQRDQHLKSSILHIAMGRRKQVIVILDNVDQRRFEVQQDAFVVAQNIASEWQAIVFIAIRPQTFFRSKQSGTLTAYPNRVFTIAPPRIDLVIERRLRFALSMAEGHTPVHKLKDIQVRLDNIAMFIRALLISLEKNMEIVKFFRILLAKTYVSRSI